MRLVRSGSSNGRTGLFQAELLTFGCHTITQLLFSLGQVEQDWSAAYRLFSAGRFDYATASAITFAQTLRHVPADELYVLVSDGTQTACSSRKMEGAGW